MNIELVGLTDEYKEQLFEMLVEWKNDIIVNHTNRSPWKIWANDFHDFIHYLMDELCSVIGFSYSVVF